MALTIIPLNTAPVTTPPAPPRNGRPETVQARLPFDYEDLPTDHPIAVPVLLIQLQDDLSRSRLREAFWISVVAHLLVLIAVVAGPKYFPMHRLIAVRSAEDLLRERQATFLELPPDQQKVTTRPKSNIISDKDRIATSRAPQIDRKTLDELRDARRPGPPQPPGMPEQPAAPAMAQAAPQQAAPNAGRGAQPPPSQNETAQLRTPAMTAKQAFGGAMSAGSAIEQAARAAAGTRGYGGAGGDYGTAFPTGGGIKSNMDILSDTMGVDFGPYLARVLHDVRQNWYQLIPEIARAPLMKKGRVGIEFAIMKDGTVAGMRLVSPSGDVSLDRAAWGGITGSNPFPPLPNEFRGQYLALRFRFFYNPDKHDLE
ncbi:MAG: TonB family protein [Terriglobales bacterium]